MSGKEVAGAWLEHTRAVCADFGDVALSGLLAVLALLLFIVEPLAAEGFGLFVPPTAMILIGLIFVLVLAAPQRGTLAVMVIAAGLRLLSWGAELVWVTPVTESADAIGAVLALLAVMWVIGGVVFGPGRITAHRVRGAIVLYLTIALVFAWLYRLIAEVAPGAFSGLTFRPGELRGLNSFIYYSLTSLTTIGFGDITPVNAFARDFTTFEAVIGQLYPAIILTRILTLYTEQRGQRK